LEFLADLVVLAKDAAEIAAGEEDGPGAARAGDRRFFAVVQAGVGDLRSGPAPAKPRLTRQPVHAAPSRAAFTISQLLRETFSHNDDDPTAGAAEIPNSKRQIPNKFKIQNLNDLNADGSVWDFGH
jgi:hypothetical protein